MELDPNLERQYLEDATTVITLKAEQVKDEARIAELQTMVAQLQALGVDDDTEVTPTEEMKAAAQAAKQARMDAGREEIKALACSLARDFRPRVIHSRPRQLRPTPRVAVRRPRIRQHRRRVHRVGGRRVAASASSDGSSSDPPGTVGDFPQLAKCNDPQDISALEVLS